MGPPDPDAPSRLTLHFQTEEIVSAVSEEQLQGAISAVLGLEDGKVHLVERVAARAVLDIVGLEVDQEHAKLMQLGSARDLTKLAAMGVTRVDVGCTLGEVEAMLVRVAELERQLAAARGAGKANEERLVARVRKQMQRVSDQEEVLQE
eukprot:1730119-Rhodomonas_salina.1